MDLILKGIIIGIGKIMPGISGSLLAMTLGIYDQIIKKISNLKKDLINNTKYLTKIALGITISIILFSKIIVKCITEYYFATMLLFIGMIISELPQTIKKIKPIKIKHKLIIITITTIINIITITQSHHQPIQQLTTIKHTPNQIIKLTLIGIIDSLASIIPGISGTAILINIGYYNILMTTFSNITNIAQINNTLFILIPFIIGFIIGTISLSKIINKIITKNNDIMNILTIIFTTTTTALLTKQTIKKKHTITETLIGIILLIIGTQLTKQINKTQKPKRINKKKKNII